MQVQKIFNKSVERVVLSSLIFQPELIEDFIAEVYEDDFYLPFHQILYKTLVSLYNSKRVISEDFIKETLENQGRFNEEEFLIIFMEPPVAKIEFYIKELKSKSTKRKLLNLAKEIESGIFVQDMESADLLNFAESEIFKIGQDNTGGGFQNTEEILDVTKAYIDKMSSRENKDLTGVTTGFDGLDKMTTGFNEGDLIILAARPAMGKTALALNFVNSSLKKGNGVAFFSLEMPVEQLMLRLLSLESHIPLQNLRTGDLENENWQKLHNTIQEYQNYKLFIDDHGGININTLKSKLRKLKKKNPQVSLAVIDYLQIMGSVSSSKDRQSEVSEISRGLKLLARELKMPIIALSQLNRSLESRNDKRPMLSDIRESGAIEQDADIILFVYRDDIYRIKEEKEKEKKARSQGEKYVSQEVEKPEELAEIIIGKQRNGPTGVVKLTFIKNLTKFVDVETFNSHQNYGQESETQIHGIEDNFQMDNINI